MSRKERLLERLKDLKLKLECRKKRFQVWQEEIDEKDEEGYATIKELEKALRFWNKEQRLNDRIDYIRYKISRLGRDCFKEQKREAM